jgi:hypothetical protein
MATKPSERFCKHGYLSEGERYNQNLHNYGDTIEERCSDYYTPEEIARMKGEINVAECAICMETLIDNNNCRLCSDGHKFHNTCLTRYWGTDSRRQNFCPLTNTIPTRGWHICRDIYDINSGGRRRKSSIKKRKYSNKKRKYSVKKRKYSVKKRKSSKKSYKKRA